MPTAFRVLFTILFCLTARAGAETFDHQPLDILLKRHVNESGRVDYEGLLAERKRLDDYVASLGAVEKKSLLTWPRGEQMTFYINAYNALTLVRILDHWPPAGWGILNPKLSIKNIPGVWNKTTNLVAGEQLTLDDIEHKILRGRFKDARIHAALVCGSNGCPALPRGAFVTETLEGQLDERFRNFARDPAKNRVDRQRGIIILSPIFKWYHEDFDEYAAELGNEKTSNPSARGYAGPLGFLAHYATPEDAAFIKTGVYKVRFSDYDWSLNAMGIKETNRP